MSRSPKPVHVSETPRLRGYVATPVQSLSLAIAVDPHTEQITEIDFLWDCAAPSSDMHPLIGRTQSLLEQYFRIPTSVDFSGLPLQLTGSQFQLSVWRTLRRIPLGQVLTYGDVSRRIGGAPRAVGGACRRNPLPILVPCHRVVGADGIGGFSGRTYGRERVLKQWLLRHEGYVI